MKNLLEVIILQVLDQDVLTLRTIRHYLAVRQAHLPVTGREMEALSLEPGRESLRERRLHLTSCLLQTRSSWTCCAAGDCSRQLD